MADHPNVELVRRGYEAFGKGDFDTLRELFAPDILWHVPGTSGLSGDYKGVDEVFGFFAQLMERSGGSFSLELHDVVGGDEHVVGLIHITASKDDKRLDVLTANVFHVNDGKATEVWDLSDTQAQAAFWG